MELNKVESFSHSIYHYVDKLLFELRGQGMEVTSIIHLLEHYVVQMMYITLLSPSIRGINAMISLCEVFAKFDITFNCKISVDIKLGQRRISCEHVNLNDKKVKWINQIKHLGNYIDKI